MCIFRLKIQFIIVARTYTKTNNTELQSTEHTLAWYSTFTYTYTYNLLLNEQNNIHWNTFTRARTHTKTQSFDWMLHANTGTSLHHQRKVNEERQHEREKRREDKRIEAVLRIFSYDVDDSMVYRNVCITHTVLTVYMERFKLPA